MLRVLFLLALLPGSYGAGQCVSFNQGDIIFVIDDSSSVMQDNFQTTTAFLGMLVGELGQRANGGVNNDDFRYCGVTFSSMPQINFNLAARDDADTINLVNGLQFMGGSTSTAAALDIVTDNVVNSPGDRPSVQNIVFVLTDGNHNGPGDLPAAAQRLVDTGTVVFAIGITSRVNQDNLNAITGGFPERTRAIDSFDELTAALAAELSQTEICPPTMPPSPKPQPTPHPPSALAQLYLEHGKTATYRPPECNKAMLGLCRDYQSCCVQQCNALDASTMEFWCLKYAHYTRFSLGCVCMWSTGAQKSPDFCEDKCPQAPDGPPGPRGFQGPPGQPGIKGGIGEEGPIGPDGPTGHVGSPGAPGDKGHAGDPGDDGNPGAPGSKGKTGPEGPPGPKGEEGEYGPDGPKGWTGNPGPDGRQGETGEKGDKGHDGHQGYHGPKGPEGHPGDRGEHGDEGMVGPAGAKGPVGQPGDDGNPGAPGDLGEIGWPGPDGDNGEDGATGFPGTPGHRGPEGEKGNKGDPGIKGDIGPPGSTGGTGIPGFKGSKGPKGDDGPSTYSDSGLIFKGEKGF